MSYSRFNYGDLAWNSETNQYEIVPLMLLGDLSISNMLLGDTQVDKVYHGTDLIWLQPVTLTVVPNSNKVTVTLFASGYPVVSGTGAQSITVVKGTNVSYTAGGVGYAIMDPVNVAVYSTQTINCRASYLNYIRKINYVTEDGIVPDNINVEFYSDNTYTTLADPKTTYIVDNIIYSSLNELCVKVSSPGYSTRRNRMKMYLRGEVDHTKPTTCAQWPLDKGSLVYEWIIGDLTYNGNESQIFTEIDSITLSEGDYRICVVGGPSPCNNYWGHGISSSGGGTIDVKVHLSAGTYSIRRNPGTSDSTQSFDVYVGGVVGGGGVSREYTTVSGGTTSCSYTILQTFLRGDGTPGEIIQIPQDSDPVTIQCGTSVFYATYGSFSSNKGSDTKYSTSSSGQGADTYRVYPTGSGAGISGWGYIRISKY